MAAAAHEVRRNGLAAESNPASDSTPADGFAITLNDTRWKSDS
jgi:hypothetical protein